MYNVLHFYVPATIQYSLYDPTVWLFVFSFKGVKVTDLCNHLWPPGNKMSAGDSSLVRHSGGCHCGRVQFEVWAPAVLKVIKCK